MTYYQQQHDPRYFAPHPQFPEPKKSSSWVGWLLMIISALIGGFLLGQSTKIEQIDDTHDNSIPTNGNSHATKDDNLTSATLVEEPKIVPEPTAETPKKFVDLDDDIIERFTADFDNINDAEKLFTKLEFKNHPELIVKYPVLAKLLGFEVAEEEGEEDITNQPL